MIQGTLIAESPRVDADLANLELMVRKTSRSRASGTTPDQAEIWTVIDFEADLAAAESLAVGLAAVLDAPGWYVNFESPAENFVNLPSPGLPLPADPSEVDDDLVRDVTDILTPLCARLYRRRAAAIRARRAVEAATGSAP